MEYVRNCCVEGRMRGWELKRRMVEGRVKKRRAYELSFMKSLSEELSASEAEKIPRSPKSRVDNSPAVEANDDNRIEQKICKGCK